MDDERGALSGAEFRLLADNLPDLCWTARADGWITWYNRRWYEYTGTTAADMEGWGWQSVHDPTVLQAVMERWTQSIGAGVPFEMTFPLKGADGVFRPFLTRVVPVRGEDDGRIVRWIGSNVDVSGQERVAAALRASEARLRMLNADLERQVIERSRERGRTWQVTPDLLCIVDAVGRFASVNPAWEAALGWMPEEMVGHPFMDLVHPDDAERTVAGWEQALEGKPVLRFENRYRSRRGGYRWLSWVAVLEEGKVYGSARDITSEREQGQALQQAEEALRQSQRMEALGQLAGGIAHDFNNVLQAVTSGLRLIERRSGDAGVKQLAAMAGEAAQRGAGVTARLLAFARKGELRSEPVDTVALLENMREILSPSLGPQVTVVVDPGAAVAALLADKAQLETALINLSVNARDAMPAGGRLTIGAAGAVIWQGEAHPAGLRAGRYVRVALRDEGVGMDAETLARACEPFFTTKPVGQGTGLGLAMARGFAEQSGGGMTICSALGEGTTVTLWFPEAAPADEAAAAAETAAADMAFVRNGRLCVMLVDDDAMVRTALLRQLEEEFACEVVWASDGLAALERLQSGEAVDLVVTDVAMPGMNGLMLTREVRARYAGLPVILLTGYADTGMRADIEALIDERTVLLRKPVAAGALLRAIVGLLGKKISVS